ncbi:pyruvate kinase [Methylobacterium radiodurans]|uniref:Pyruvate kinase n=1 Tax=Methylobacterium radiodurans TaxID=2202828 RepID=A0A2U8VN04_9HYPH|nr:pyruvate kinase [Methylobacterium radiodurans]AWN35069.1 pyruvate kinase [Methylobacterium radiodurans]
MRRSRNAKVVATLGPASDSAGAIEDLFLAGADVFRLNFSHGTEADHAERVRTIRTLESKVGRPIGILMDLQGPKLRVGTFADGAVRLEAGAAFRLDLDAALGDGRRVSLPHPEIFAALSPGTDILLDDGKLRLEVLSCGPDHAETVVRVGGPLSARKGVNVPGVVLPMSPLTARDRRHLAFGLDLGVDWVALSFVQRPEDILEARELIGDRALVMAKIEKPAAVDRLDEIVSLCDGIMVARGDLGVEMPTEEVPIVQRTIIRSCRREGKPVIVATQMLESMTASPVPTRAEASDVATAVYEGADAVMLSAESASGAYPREAVAMMDSILRRVERDPQYRVLLDGQHGAPRATLADAICCALRRTAHVINARATVSYTRSGSTSLRAARERPVAPILSLTPSIDTARRLTVAWGIHSVVVENEASDEASMTELACEAVVEEGFAEAGDNIVITAGVPFGVSGTTNLLRLATLSRKAA